jgi:light-regulated signal transduction histidine kinase (bacteriophytochrome)
MEETAIPWTRIAAFVRQHTHDVRNGLNSLDLETELLTELVTDTEANASVGRVRKQLRGIAQQLRGLSMLFQEPLPTIAKIPARVLMNIWREKLKALPNAPEVHWVDELGDAPVEVETDVEMMASVFRELLSNAVMYSPGEALTISVRCTAGIVVFEQREPKPASVATDPSTWGQPLATTRRDHYGMGLWMARRQMESCGAVLVQRYLPGEVCLISRITLHAV